MERDELFAYMLEHCQAGIAELGMTPDDLDFVVCTPDEVRYPVQVENAVRWSYLFRYRFKDGRWAYKVIWLYSDECPSGVYQNYYDHGLDEARRLHHARFMLASDQKQK